MDATVKCPHCRKITGLYEMPQISQMRFEKRCDECGRQFCIHVSLSGGVPTGMQRAKRWIGTIAGIALCGTSILLTRESGLGYPLLMFAIVSTIIANIKED